MNSRVIVVITDIVGISGIRINKAILGGETSGEKLAGYFENFVKKQRINC